MRHAAGGEFKRIIAIGLVHLLLLIALPSCTAREMADLYDGSAPTPNTETEESGWSRVQAVEPDTKTEVELSDLKKVSPDWDTSGLFHSATEDTLTLRYEDNQLHTFQKPEIERVLAYRPVSERWAGWATLAVSSMIVAFILRGDTEGAPLVLLPFVAGPTAIAFFGSAPMKEVYRAETKGDAK